MKKSKREKFLSVALTLPLTGRLITSLELPFRVGQSLAWVYKQEAAGNFPKRIRTGRRSIAWHGDEIQAWVDDREQV